MLYRMELWVGEEYQGVGMFCGIDALTEDDIEKADILMESFSNDLEVPEISEESEFYFTEAGMEKFHHEISGIVEIFKRNGIFEVKMAQIKETDSVKILYQDEYQAAVETDDSMNHKQVKEIY